MKTLKEQLEEVIKKNLPENKKSMINRMYDNGFDQSLSQINPSLIADEVLKVVVEKIEKHKQDIVFLSKQIAFQDKKLQTIYKSQINCVEDILELLNNHN